MFPLITWVLEQIVFEPVKVLPKERLQEYDSILRILENVYIKRFPFNFFFLLDNWVLKWNWKKMELKEE